VDGSPSGPVANPRVPPVAKTTRTHELAVQLGLGSHTGPGSLIKRGITARPSGGRSGLSFARMVDAADRRGDHLRPAARNNGLPDSAPY